MKKINAIFSDIDGTILKETKFNNDVFSKQTLKAIKELSDTKVPLILATGRALTRTRNIANYLEKKANKVFIPYLISFNGAVIFDNINKKIIENFVYSDEIKNHICAYLEEKKFDYFLVDQNYLLHYKKSLFSAFFAYTWYRKYKKTHNNDYKKITNIQKILIFTKKPNAKSLKKEIEGIFEDVYVSCFGNYVIEIIDKKINKFFALKKVTKLLNTNIENVAAIGNEGNDLMMIQNAGFGVAVDFYKNLHLPFEKEKIGFFTSNTNGNAFFWTWEYLKHKKCI